MGRIAERFAELKHRNEGALIGYLTLGDPSPQVSAKLAACLAENVDILELGIPFSDPIADGPTIQGAIDRALRAGTNTDHCFEIAARLRREGVEIPLVFMTYYNIVLQYGEERFVSKCREVGVDGLLVSDLPVEEASQLVKICRKYSVDTIFLIAPTTTEERIKKILRKASGFVYLVSLLGTTGAREKLSEVTIEKTKWALQYVRDLPLAVGFGISRPEHVRAVIEAGAAGVVVGSAFVKIIEKRGANACDELRSFAARLKSGTKLG